MLSPAQYFDRYRSITVPAVDGDDLATSLHVDHYRLGAPQPAIDERYKLGKKVEKDLAIRRKTDPQAGVRVRVDTSTGREDREFPTFSMKSEDQLWALIRYPYVGKGSPESIQVALQLAAVDLPGSPPFVRPEAFQSYCDKWLGLDCNGFVGNFLRHEHAAIPWWDVTSTGGIEPDDKISDIWTKFEGEVRESADAINPDDLNLLVMVDAAGKIVPGGVAGAYGHIGISGPGESSSVPGLKGKLPGAGDDAVPAICVVESTAAKKADGNNGLARSFYAYVENPAQPGVFRFHRGVNGGLISMRVKAAAWPA